MSGRADGAGEEGADEADEDEGAEVGGQRQKGIKEGGGVAGAEKHEFASEAVGEDAPDDVGDAQTGHPGEVVERDVEAAELFVVHVEIFPQEQGDEGHTAPEPDHGEKL